MSECHGCKCNPNGCPNERKLKAYEVQLALAREGLEEIVNDESGDKSWWYIAKSTLSKLSEGEGGKDD